jgi:hypothetical protein
MHKNSVENLSRSLGYDKSFAISSSGRSGGLGLFWNNEIKIEVLPYSQYHLDVIVSEQGQENWRLTVVYGEAQVSERHKTWDMLKFIRSSNDLPWLCIGDFNEVLHREEHEGVNERSYSQMAGFRDMIDVCGLCDLGYRGVPWTFEKKVTGGSFCRTRLDHALALPSWSARFLGAEVQHLASIATSDHLPILLRREPVRVGGSAKRPFRYEVAWEGAEEFENKLKDSWLTGGRSESLEDLQHKISNLSAEMLRWGCHSVGSVQAEIRSLQRELEALRMAPDRTGPSSTEQEIVAKLNSLLE